MPDEAPTNVLRELSLCGQCRSSTYLIWRKSQADTGKLPKLVTRKNDLDLYYLVKCDYLKQVIPEPEGLLTCEAQEPPEEI